MAQNTWSLPAADTEFFGLSRTKYNDALNNLATLHSGLVAPTVVHDYMLWMNTTLGVVQQEDGGGGWVTLWSNEAYGGFLCIDGSNVMTGDLDMDGNDIILDADGDTKIVNDTDDEISFELGGAEELLLTATIADFKGNYIQNCAMAVNVATPAGATAYQIELKTSGGTTIYVPAYAAAWS